jgi:vacuolar-type H+-ATPase subunit E/Vma4
MQDEKAAVVASKKDIAILADLNNASGFEFIPYQTENMPPGVVIMSKDKRYRVINTLHSRLERAKTELVPVIDEVFFRSQESEVRSQKNGK